MQNRNKYNENVQFELLDITKSVEVNYLIRHYSPDRIINTAAITQVDKCEEDKLLCWETNVEAVRNIVFAANKIKAHFTHLSSDFIFNGLNAPYNENDEANPLSYYGLSKLESERIVRENSNKWAIIRTILVYGFNNYMTRLNIVLWIYNNLKDNKNIKVVNDQFRTPTFINDLANGCKLIAELNKEGIFHISGNEMMAISDIAYKVADFFNLDKKLITPVSTIELNEKAKRPYKTGFNLSKSQLELGFFPISFKEGLKMIKNQMENYDS